MSEKQSTQAMAAAHASASPKSVRPSAWKATPAIVTAASRLVTLKSSFRPVVRSARSATASPTAAATPAPTGPTRKKATGRMVSINVNVHLWRRNSSRMVNDPPSANATARIAMVRASPSVEPAPMLRRAKPTAKAASNATRSPIRLPTLP
ncbi:MAG: hypothetical protein M5T61_01140 [Acidimicrobiia bacterium]|nr:hypothetical protein [Acidimicrobiia bacterium]